MTLGDIMSTEVRTIEMDGTLDQMQRIFEANNFHHLVVVESRLPVGVISDRDLLKHLSPFVGVPMAERTQDTRTLQRRAHQIMTRQIVSARESTTIEEGAKLILEHSVSCLPILDAGKRLSGIVTWKDLLRAAFPVDA